MSMAIGPIKTRNRVFLAPMSGVSDAPFRAVAQSHGAGLVISEMVASEELVRQRPDVLRRAADSGSPRVIQLVGREARWMAEGARVAEDLGADIIDINMGCPARQVTGGLSGSALMRDLKHALALIEATVKATVRPVTLKMRLGWDHATRNAPELARLAESAGVKMITVHGRTRCQVYTGRADWAAIRVVREAITIPLIANGDCMTAEDARKVLRLSGADGVMIGRASYGRPWWPGVIAERLDPGSGSAEPSLAQEADIVLSHHDAMLGLYGNALGNRMARKHIGWTIARHAKDGRLSANEAAGWREQLLKSAENAAVVRGLRHFFERLMEAEAQGA
jgi:nifR3 family TIM-barrel protein